MKELIYQSVTYRLSFADLFRPLTDTEERELRDSVKDVGVLCPVFVYDSETYGANCVIDGANRLRIADEEDVVVAVEKLTLNDEEAGRRAEDLNIAAAR